MPTWPVAAVLICLTLILIALLFRRAFNALIDELASLLKRTNNLSLKSKDLSLETNTESQLQAQQREGTKDSPLGIASPSNNEDKNANEAELKRNQAQDFGKQFATVSIREALIREDLKGLGYLVPDDELTSVLVRHLASVALLLSCQKLYNAIFGSQLRLLAFTNKNGPVSDDIVQIFYDAASTAFPDAYSSKSLEDWKQFLLNEGALVKSGEKLALTQFGRDFLVWTVIEGVNTEKPL